MPRRAPPASTALALLLLLAAPARAEPPAGVFEATEGAFAACEARGGVARILDGYETSADLNGDGKPDFVTDLARIACGEADGAFCGPEGCAATLWLSKPGGAYQSLDLGAVTDIELMPPAGAEGGPPVLRTLHGASTCASAGLASATCIRDWRLADDSAPVPPPFTTLAVERPLPRPAPEQLRRFVPQSGWTLRAVPEGSPVALGIGPGNLLSIGAFCLADAPFLALRFREPPEGPALTVSFDFPAGAVETEALYEETAGGAFVVDLADSPLARRLAGRDAEVPIDIDGRREGTLSLTGSTASLRAALGACYAF